MNRPGFEAPSFRQCRKQLPKRDFKAKRTTLRTKSAHLAPEGHLGRSVRSQETQLHAGSSRLLCVQLFHNVELLVRIVLLTNASQQDSKLIMCFHGIRIEIGRASCRERV